jgi:hypothetical protein
MLPIPQLSPFTSLIGFVLGFPTLMGTYYQTWRARQEAALAREGLSYSQNCVEFTLEDGTLINLVALQALHSLPKPGDVVFLPGAEFGSDASNVAGAFRISRVEHIYSRIERSAHHPLQAHLAKVVAHVDHL